MSFIKDYLKGFAIRRSPAKFIVFITPHEIILKFVIEKCVFDRMLGQDGADSESLETFIEGTVIKPDFFIEIKTDLVGCGGIIEVSEPNV